MQLRSLFLIASILCSFSTLLKAQESITHQNLYWTRYYNQYSFNSKLSWHNEADMRRFLENNKLQHLIFHSHVHYKVLPNLDVALGLTYSRQNPQFPDATSDLVVPEIRPFQEITHSQALSKRFTLSHRFRLDERFISKNDGKVLQDGYDFNLRYRYRIQGVCNLSKKEDKTPTTAKIADELMLNSGGNIIYNHFDQNRIYLGIEQSISPSLSVELGYLRWFQQRSSGKDFFDRNIYRLTIYHRLKAQNK